MKFGDLVLIRAPCRSYPRSRNRGDDPYAWNQDTPVIYLSEKKEGDLATFTNPRTFYEVLTPNGVHEIYSAFCYEP
jgi:hypothetical protein